LFRTVSWIRPPQTQTQAPRSAIAPGSKISGGKLLSSKTPHVVNWVAILLRLAALAIGRTDTCLGLFYRRIKFNHGPAKAMSATA
jgi:transposase